MLMLTLMSKCEPALSVNRIDDQKVLSHLESYTVSTWVSTACKNILKMPLREERVVLHINQVYSVNKVWKAARARACGLKNIKPIQATMFKVTDYVSLCTDKGKQVLQTFHFFARCGVNFSCINYPIKIWVSNSILFWIFSS